MESELTGRGRNSSFSPRAPDALLFSQFGGTRPEEQGLTWWSERGKLWAVTFPSPHSPLSWFPQRALPSPSNTHQNFSGGLGKRERVSAFSLLPADVSRQLLLPKGPRLELGGRESAWAAALRSPRDDFAPGTLTLPQAAWPVRESVIQPAARGGPDKWPPASLQCCLAPGDGCLRQEAFNLHGGNLEFRGTNQLPSPGSSVELCNLGLCKENPLSSEPGKGLVIHEAWEQRQHEPSVYLPFGCGSGN